jgi:transitional endoplasmic reticulum ATPase
MDLKDRLKSTTMEPQTFNIDDKQYYRTKNLDRELEGIIKTIQNIDQFGTEMGHRNYLLTGPAGTGKTLGVKYVASKLQIPVYDGKNIFGPQAIIQVFDSMRELAKKQKVILLINEIDKYSSREDVVDPSQAQTLNQLLDEMDGTKSNHNIFIFGTTNRANHIDNALRRGKRFSKEIEFMAPDRTGRKVILDIHAYGKGGHKFKVPDAVLNEAADISFGYTGADLVSLLNESFTNAMLDDRKDITKDDLQYALQHTKPSAIKDMPFEESKLNFSSIGGYKDHVALVKRVMSNSSGSMMLFYGPKGTGKTAMGEAIAGEYKYNYLKVCGSEAEDKYVGETGKIIDKYLSRAKQLAPCVLVFDEMDALLEKKGLTSHKGSWTGLLQSRLSKPIPGVYIVGTMNRPDIINGTFIDRFVHKLYFAMPTPEEQVEVWKKYAPAMDAESLVSYNNKLSCRQIARATDMIKDYGLKPSMEVYKNIISQFENVEDVDYARIVEKVGDSVKSYASIKAFLGDAK